MAEPTNYRARYEAVADWWTDMPEAEPRTRVKVPEGSDSCVVYVTADGQLEYDRRRSLEIDTTYE